MSMVKPSVSIDRSVSVGALLRPRSSSLAVRLLTVLLLVLSAGRRCPTVSHGVTGTRLSAVVKGGIATTAGISATTKAIVGAFTKIPQGNLAVSAVLSAGTLLFSADQVEAGIDDLQCKSINFPGSPCANLTIQGCNQSNNLCCQGYCPCDEALWSDIGCCSCNGWQACQNSFDAIFYDNVCNGDYSCQYSKNITVYSGSCNNQYSCSQSPYLTVGSGSCNGEFSCASCCGPSELLPCRNIVIPNNECNDPSASGAMTSCPWCPGCKNKRGTSCYNTNLTGQAILSDAGIAAQRALKKKMFKQKDKTTKKTPMNCSSAKDKIVSYFQAQGIPKLRSMYTSGKVAKTSKQGGHRKRSRDCNVELSWLFEHLEEDELLQACAELETHTTKLQAHLGKSWTIKTLKCIPEDKNKIY